MEIIVALVVIGLAGYWIYSSSKKPNTPSQLEVEVKVEAPVAAADVAPQPVVVAVEGAGSVEVPAAPVKAKRAPAKTAAKKAPAKKKPSA